MRQALAAIGLTAGLIIGGTALATTAAHANASSELCNGGSPAECMNLWDGAGGAGYIQTYTSGPDNDYMLIQLIAGRCQAGSDYTTANCPYNGVPAGQAIFQIVDIVGQCVGDYNGSQYSARAGGFDGCNNVNTGYGGGWGTVFFVGYAGGCPNGSFAAESFHWPTGGLDSAGTANDQPWYLNSNPATCLFPTTG